MDLWRRAVGEKELEDTGGGSHLREGVQDGVGRELRLGRGDSTQGKSISGRRKRRNWRRHAKTRGWRQSSTAYDLWSPQEYLERHPVGERRTFLDGWIRREDYGQERVKK